MLTGGLQQCGWLVGTLCVASVTAHRLLATTRRAFGSSPCVGGPHSTMLMSVWNA